MNVFIVMLGIGVALILLSALLPKGKKITTFERKTPTIKVKMKEKHSSRHNGNQKSLRNAQNKKHADERMVDVWRMNKGQIDIKEFQQKWGNI